MAWKITSPEYPVSPAPIYGKQRPPPKPNAWKHCPACGCKLDSSFNFCPECANVVDSIQMFSSLLPKTCESCGENLKETYKFCPGCKQTIDLSWRDVLVCQGCEAVPPNGANYCPKCGKARGAPVSQPHPI